MITFRVVCRDAVDYARALTWQECDVLAARYQIDGFGVLTFYDAADTPVQSFASGFWASVTRQ